MSTRGKVCAFFNTPRGCRHGTECKFAHISEDGASSSAGGTWRQAPGAPWGIAVSTTRANPVQTAGSKICAYLNRPGGCYKGDQCGFRHVKADNAGMCGGSGDTAGQGSGQQLSSGAGPPDVRSRFRRMAHVVPPLHQLPQFLDAALACLDAGEDTAELVVKALGSSEAPEERSYAREHVQYALQAALSDGSRQQWELLLPVLRLSSHHALLDSMHTSHANMYLSCIKRWLATATGWPAVARWLQHLLDAGWQPSALSAGAVKSWLDVLQPVAALLEQLLSRFQGADDFEQHKNAARSVAAVLRAAYTGKVQPSVGMGDRGRARVLLLALDAIDSLIAHGSIVREFLSAKEEAQRRKQAAAAAAAASQSQLQQLRDRDPDHLPGQLRPRGPRHDNDNADYTLISVLPTPQELQCPEQPYLPPNRPGGIPHLDAQPVRALLERHFRLLRHDVVQPVVLATHKFREYGGIKQLQTATAKPGKAAGRLRLDDTMLYTFRHVAFMGVGSSPRGDTFYMVSFEQPAALERHTSEGERKAWWETSKRLAHGTLCVLWTEPPGRQEPVLLLAVVAERDTRKLCKARPELGLRLFEGVGNEALLTFVAANQGTQGEIIMLQENNAFFAYEPVLKALQAAHSRTTPLDRYLAARVSPNTQQCGITQVDLPAYLLDKPQLDLSCLMDPATLQGLPAAEQARLKHVLCHVDPSEGVEGFPVAELVAASTFDAAQASALACALLREVAVVQGPPGTGKTFLGVKLMGVLLKCLSRAPPLRRLLHDDGDLRADAHAAEDVGTGPVLVVCFTNHALDSFLEGLLDAGIKSLVRVGGMSRVSERLQPKCLQNMQDKAGGPAIAKLQQRKNQLIEQLDAFSQQLQAASRRQSVPAWLRGGQELVEEELGVLAATSFASGLRAWNEGYQDPDEEWTVVRNAKHTDDLLQDWLRSQPSNDWVWGRLPELCRTDLELAILQDVGDYKTWAQLSRDTARGGAVYLPAPPQPPAMLQVMDRRQRPLAELRDAMREGDSVWSLSSAERECLAHHLVQQQYKWLVRDVQDVCQQLHKVQQDLQAEYDSCALRTLRRAQVVGMTTSGVAQRKDLVTALGAQVVLVEEAAEVFEAHVLVCLSKHTQHLILIGDHEQLRPKPNLYELQAISGRQLDLDISLFERLVTQQGFPMATLQQQRRMRPAISRLLLPIYPHLRDHPSVATYPEVQGMAHSLFFLDHDHPEQGKDEGRSKSNVWEARYCVSMARYLMQQGYGPEDVIILTPYVGQLFALRAELRASKMTVVLSDKDKDDLAQAGLADSEDEEEDAVGQANAASAASTSQAARTSSASAASTASTWRPSLPPGTKVITDAGCKIRVATIDNFQGEEGKLIILSLTRNNKAGEIGFLKMRNRICVMISRAQHGMYILGNAASLRANAGRSPMWPQVLDALEAEGRVGDSLLVRCQRHGTETRIREVEDFELLVGDGGCLEMCDQLLPCGHPCPRRCHADDPQHLNARCYKPCDRLMPHCQHPCPKLCYQDCGQCIQRISKHVLPCGHEATNIQCWRRFKVGELPCQHLVPVVPPCGHRLTVACHERPAFEAGQRTCTQQVSATLPVCGHTIQVECGLRDASVANPTACTHECGRQLRCSHTCRAACGQCLLTTLGTHESKLIDGFLAASESRAVRGDWEVADTGRALYAKHQRWLKFLERNVQAGSAYAGWLKAHLEEGNCCHPACSQPCTRDFPCGHTCGQACHMGAPCPPCTKRCWMGCAHSQCRKGCGQACVPCAGTCVWQCEHQGACTAPCGAPCDRLPCDLRCTRRLKCSHQCAGLCGEACSDKLCVHPDCLAKAPEKLKDQVVDVIMCRTFSDLDDGDVDEDPLLLLGCGHVLTKSTLDGLVDMEQYYKRAPGESAWLAVKELPEDLQKPPACPSCRVPLHGVRRAGRALHKAALDLVDRKHMEASRRMLHDVQQQLQAVRDRVQAEPNGLTEKRAAAAGKQLQAVAQAFEHVCNKLTRSPKQQVYEAALSRLLKAASAGTEPPPAADAAAASSSAPPSPSPSGSPSQAASTNAGSPSSSDSTPAAEHTDARQRAAAAALARANKPDTSSEAATAAGGAAAAAAVSRPGVFGRMLGAVRQLACASERPSEEAVAHCSRCGARGATSAAGSTPALCPACTAEAARQVVQDAQLSAASAAVCSALKVDSTQLSRARAGLLDVLQLQLEVGRRAFQGAQDAPGGLQARAAGKGQGAAGRTARLHRVAYQLQQAYEDMEVAAAGAAACAAAQWVQEAASSRSWTSALQLMEQRVCMVLQRTRQLQALQQWQRNAQAGSSTWEQDKAQLLGLLDKVADLTLRARLLMAQWQASLGDADRAAGLEEDASYQHILTLAGEASQLKEQLERSQEQTWLEVLTAVAVNEHGGRSNALDYMSRHLYRCPNGHMYVIADCGMAVQQSRCPECGAAIGGGGYQLRADNQQAADVVARLRELQVVG